MTATRKWPRVAAALGSSDMRGILRDPLLIMVFASPLLYVLMVRLPVPALTDHLAETYNFDLTPYYSLIVSSFPILGTMLLLGCIGGLMLLEEKDGATLHALRVTPLPLSGFAFYRCATLIVVTSVYVTVASALTGLAPTTVIPVVVLLGPVTGLVTIVIALAMAAIANNKVEGLALIRALGFVLFLLPAGAFLVDSSWEPVFWLLPSYWPSKALWVAWDGDTYWPFVLVGTVFNTFVATALARLFIRRSSRS